MTATQILERANHASQAKSSPVRILHVHSGNLHGGIETAMLTMSRSRAFAADLHAEFALCFEGRFSHRLRESGMSIHHLGEARTRNPLSVIRARRRLHLLLKSRKYDVVICHSPWSQAMFGPVVQRSGKANLYWAHDTVKGEHWLERWAGMHPPSFAICNSEFTRSSLSNIFGDIDARIVHYPVVLNSVRLSADERILVRAQANTPGDAVVIVQVSRMEAWKGHANLIQALHKLKEEKSWIAWFVGGAQRPKEAQYADEIQNLANHLGVSDRIRFLGQRSDVPQILAASDIFCQANAVPEPFGIVFVEALSSGLPVVSFEMGGVQEIVDSSCGILVKPNDIETLATSLKRLILDPSIRLRLSENAPARAQQLCDPQIQMNSLQSLLASLLRGGPVS